MCGIAGFAGIDGADEVTRVEQMVFALRRRGPDAEGVETWPHAVLGHRRLSIFDLSALGRQPMMSPDRSTAVVFNGAIYNFVPLRNELIARGYQFTSQTDTEVLVHGYCEWGIEGLVSRIRGMFAFGLWDDRRQTLFLVRDRLGVKPLFFAARNDSIAFASTARALRAAGVVHELDNLAMAEYLEFGYVTDQRAIYKGAGKVPAATIVEWSATDGLRMREYWTVPKPRSSRITFQDAVEETERLLLRAVETRLQADVPVGALLSGGVDSSLVCWAIAKLGGDVTAYTVGTPGDTWDETADARKTAAELGISHEVRNLQQADNPNIQELSAAYGEPFACASALGMLRISEAISPAAKVLLTGDGGDDVFLGYPEHRHLWVAQHVARTLPPGDWWKILRGRIPRVGPLRRGVTFLDFATGGLGGIVRAHDGLPMYLDSRLLGERLSEVRLPQRELPWSRESAVRVLSEFLVYDRGNRFVGEYMTKVDGATMHHGLEARSPFLDQALWEFASTLPFSVRLHRGVLKAVLREIARRRVGPRVASGAKRGFGVPVQRWIAGRWRSTLEELFREPLFEEQGWINGAAARHQLLLASKKGWAPKQLWYLAVLESWLRYEQRLNARSAPAALLV